MALTVLSWVVPLVLCLPLGWSFVCSFRNKDIRNGQKKKNKKKKRKKESPWRQRLHAIRHLDTNLYPSQNDLQRIHRYLQQRLPPELVTMIYKDILSDLKLVRHSYSYINLLAPPASAPDAYKVAHQGDRLSWWSNKSITIWPVLNWYLTRNTNAEIYAKKYFGAFVDAGVDGVGVGGREGGNEFRAYWGLDRASDAFWVFRAMMEQARGSDGDGGKMRIEIAHPALRGIRRVKVHFFSDNKMLGGERRKAAR